MLANSYYPMGDTERDFEGIGCSVPKIYPKVLGLRDLREIFYHLVVCWTYLGAIDNMVSEAETFLADSED